MSYKEFRAVCTKEWATPLSDRLSELGALSVTYLDAEDEPIYEPKNDETRLWSRTCVHALFEHDAQNITSALFDLEPELAEDLREIEWLTIEEQAWERAWMDSFAPMHFGHDLWVVPSHTPAPNPDGVNIFLDPGLAFGSGTHETTRLCLEWLAAHPPKDKIVIDYGCGSGILAIAAKKLKAQSVWALDIDEQALIATKDNLLRNQLDPIALQTVLNAEDITEKADILMANILAAPLQELTLTFYDLLKPNGTLVLSGILKEQSQQLINHYAAQFHFIQESVLGDWIRLVFERKD